MGYGHERAADPLRSLAGTDGVIIANNYQGIPDADQRIWENSRHFYEFISRLTHIPFIGAALFDWYDHAFQEIEPFYPKRDLSQSSFQLRQMYGLMRRRKWGKNLIDYLNQKPELPLISTFFIPAFFAEEHGYRGDIYCIATDTDISRTWAPLEPKKTRIRYCAPTSRAAERLACYGIPEKNIYLTGFPLPADNLGGANLPTLKQDLWARIHHLDPSHRFINKYRESLARYLGQEDHHCSGGCSLTLTFAVGGAGAQREIGGAIIRSLARQIRQNALRLRLVAGTRNEVYRYFQKALQAAGLGNQLGRGVEIISATDKAGYFKKFNETLRTTDVLWTKPSELAFFAGLGLPIIIAPPIGSQEVFNQRWLESLGAGIDQLDPQYTHQWLPDWLESGWLAEAALQGFLDAPKQGTYVIEQLLSGRVPKPESGLELL